MTPDIVIVSAARTPQGRLGGQLSTVPAVTLGATAIAGALAQGGVSPEEVDAVVMGHVLAAGTGQNAARQAAVAAGIGWRTHAASVNKVCLSGLTAVIDAKRMIAAGDADVVVAGGMESMSLAPHLLPGSRMGWAYGAVEMVDHTAFDGLTDAYDGVSMGLSTDRGNGERAITREDQDRVALLSHQRAAAAQDAGAFAAEIVAVEVARRRQEPLVVNEDEGVRPESTMATLARLRPAFSESGTITAGNASPISDGAAALVVTTRAIADDRGWPILATVGSAGQVAGPDNSLHSQPSRALQQALTRQRLGAESLTMIEINEAFGSVLAQSRRDLGVEEDVVNIHGGGIALGHPIGASGARLVVHAAHELARRGAGAAGIALCGGGGQGEALILTR
ncbi:MULTISPECIES: acetyl-CoA C-acyltransferase [unclassified Microbacterium]|uniref:acetyl-CoA C-acyltransferase n=1 Tax=unclassified Microbacterium TaxID=2609290 RepID=UPI003868CA2B